MDWILDLLTTYIHHSELYFTDHWHTQTSVLSLLQSPLAVSWQRLLPMEILHLPFSRRYCPANIPQLNCQPACGPLVNWQLNCVPGWPPFHTSLLVFSSQAEQLTTELSHSPTSYFTSLHSTELLTTLTTTNSLLQIGLLITFRHEPHRKHRFHCYNLTIPRPLHRNGCSFIRLLHSNGTTCYNTFLVPAFD
jgi:hypothetical protein